MPVMSLERSDRARLGRIADWLVVAITVSLLWSTSMSAILNHPLADRSRSLSWSCVDLARSEDAGRGLARDALGFCCPRNAVGRRQLVGALTVCADFTSSFLFRCCTHRFAAPIVRSGRSSLTHPGALKRADPCLQGKVNMRHRICPTRRTVEAWRHTSSL
jgi:hypothetical protein